MSDKERPDNMPPVQPPIGPGGTPPVDYDADIENWFTYHKPESPIQTGQYEMIRDKGKEFAQLIRNNTPRSADQTAAIRKIREAVMTANAAIACGGK